MKIAFFDAKPYDSSCLISESAECDEVGGFLGVDAEVGKSSNRGNLVSSASISSKGSGG